jgi:hypothetical protein
VLSGSSKLVVLLQKDAAKPRASAIFINSVARDRSTLVSLAKLDFLFKRQKRRFLAAVMGAKVGANVHSRQAMPGDVQRTLLQVNSMQGDIGL